MESSIELRGLQQDPDSQAAEKDGEIDKVTNCVTWYQNVHLEKMIWAIDRQFLI